MMHCLSRDLYHIAPCKWEWILKYSRTINFLLFFHFIPILFCKIAPEKPSDKVLQPYCWNEFDDVASRTYASPVAVRATCIVVYSRGSFAQFNSTFYVTQVLKGGPLFSKILEESPRIQLHFGTTDSWTTIPSTKAEAVQEGLLRNQMCSIPKVDLQKEYLLFLKPHVEAGDFDAGNDVMQEAPLSTNMPATAWSIYAAPEVFTEAALAAVHKVARRGTCKILAGLAISLPTVVWFVCYDRSDFF